VSAKLERYTDYRDSGVDWLGQVPAHWIVGRAKASFQEVDERSISGNEELLSVSHKTGVTPRRLKNITMFKAESYAGYKLCQPGDLVVNTMWAWMAALGVSQHAGIVSNAYGVYRPRENVVMDGRYYDYLLRTEVYRAEYVRRSTGITTSRLRLYSSKLLAMPLIQPPPDDQRRIADFLDVYATQVQRLIVAKRRTIAVLLERKQAILTGLLRRGLTESETVSGDLPWLDKRPADWRVNRLKPFVTNVTDLATISAIDDIIITLDRVESGTGRVIEGAPRADKEFVGKRFKQDDVLFGKLRPYLAKVTRTSGAGLAGTEFLVLRGHTGVFRPRFLEQLLRSKPFIDYVASQSVGAKMPRTEWEAIGSVPVIIPSLLDQDRLLELFDLASGDLDAAIKRERSQIDLILEYRDALVAAAVTGRIDVRAAQIAVIETESEALIDDATIDDEDMEDALEQVD
jgi:type I restriction enzyme S subunit